MNRTEFITPDNRKAAEYSARILLRNVAFAAVEARLLGVLPVGTLGYQLLQVSVTWSKHDNEISAIFPFKLVVESRSESNESAEPIADISVIMHLKYKLVENNGLITLEDLPHVIGILGYMHAWPYFRADVQWLTTKLGFPALILPVVLSSQIGDRVAVRPHPVGTDGPKIVEVEGTAAMPAALPPVTSSETKQAKAKKPPRRKI